MLGCPGAVCAYLPSKSFERQFSGSSHNHQFSLRLLPDTFHKDADAGGEKEASPRFPDVSADGRARLLSGIDEVKRDGLSGWKGSGLRRVSSEPLCRRSFQTELVGLSVDSGPTRLVLGSTNLFPLNKTTTGRPG